VGRRSAEELHLYGTGGCTPVLLLRILFRLLLLGAPEEESLEP